MRHRAVTTVEQQLSCRSATLELIGDEGGVGELGGEAVDQDGRQLGQGRGRRDQPGEI